MTQKGCGMYQEFSPLLSVVSFSLNIPSSSSSVLSFIFLATSVCSYFEAYK